MVKIRVILAMCFAFGVFNYANGDQPLQLEEKGKIEVNDDQDVNGSNEPLSFRSSANANAVASSRLTPVGIQMPGNNQRIPIAGQPSPVPILQSKNNQPVPAAIQPTLQLVECYACTGCPTVLANTTVKLCPYSPNPLRQGKCVIYKEQYRNMKTPWYIRGCASERGSCGDIKQSHDPHGDYVTLESCSECEGDRCNGASSSMVDIAVAFITFAVMPMLGKYALS